MAISAIIINGRVTIDGINLIEPYRVDYLTQTIQTYSHLLDATAPLTLEQLAARIEAGSRLLRAQVAAHYLRSVASDAIRQTRPPAHLRSA